MLADVLQPLASLAAVWLLVALLAGVLPKKAAARVRGLPLRLVRLVVRLVRLAVRKIRAQVRARRRARARAARATTEPGVSPRRTRRAAP